MSRTYHSPHALHHPQLQLPIPSWFETFIVWFVYYGLGIHDTIVRIHVVVVELYQV